VVTSYIMVLHSIPVDTVEDGQTHLAPVRLRTGSASEGPGMLSSSHRLGFAILPAQSSAVSGHLSSSPEVWGTVLSDKSEEMFRFLLGVQGDHLHALGLTVLSATIPVKVVSMISPGQKITLSLPLVISLRLGGNWKSFGSS